MGTYCALHVKAGDKIPLVSELERFLAETHRGRVIKTTTADTFGALYGDEFVNSREEPTKFALVFEQPDWATVHFNSFFRPRDLATDLSAKLSTVVISTLAQTCSDAYELILCDSGRHLRTLEFADGEWVSQEGAPLPFESEPIGKNIAEAGEEPWYVFEEESVREYCKHFGLQFWTNASANTVHPQFTIICALPARAYASEQRQ
jgi:hypothetical protein